MATLPPEPARWSYGDIPETVFWGETTASLIGGVALILLSSFSFLVAGLSLAGFSGGSARTAVFPAALGVTMLVASDLSLSLALLSDREVRITVSEVGIERAVLRGPRLACSSPRASRSLLLQFPIPVLRRFDRLDWPQITVRSSPSRGAGRLYEDGLDLWFYRSWGKQLVRVARVRVPRERGVEIMARASAAGATTQG